MEGRPRYFVNTPIPGELDVGKAYTFSLLVCFKAAKHKGSIGRALKRPAALFKEDESAVSISTVRCRCCLLEIAACRSAEFFMELTPDLLGVVLLFGAASGLSIHCH